MATLIESLKPSAPTAIRPIQNHFDSPRKAKLAAKPHVAITADDNRVRMRPETSRSTWIPCFNDELTASALTERNEFSDISKEVPKRMKAQKIKATNSWCPS